MGSGHSEKTTIRGLRMKKLPKVTINIPTYNQEKYIARAIESCLKQDYPNLEIIVSDDCSTDETFAIAKRYEGDIVKVCKTLKNIGRVANYRYTLQNLSSGDWVVNLDGDDFYDDSTFVSEAIHHISRDSSIVMYAAGAKALYEETGKIEISVMGIEQESICMPGTAFVLNYPTLNATQHFAVIYNRKLALQTGFYILDSLGTDTDSLCRLALKGNVFIQKKYVGVWTSHQHNASYTLTMLDIEKEINMLTHIAAELKNYVPQKVADSWLMQRVEEKNRFALNLNLSKLPLKEAWKLYQQNAKPSRFFVREGAKLFLRFLHLKP